LRSLAISADYGADRSGEPPAIMPQRGAQGDTAADHVQAARLAVADFRCKPMQIKTMMSLPVNAGQLHRAANLKGISRRASCGHDSGQVLALALLGTERSGMIAEHGLDRGELPRTGRPAGRGQARRR
jgi:hypothetical protein